MTMLFPHLLSETEIAGCRLRNRIVSTGHHTYLSDGAPDERLVAYHEARARGGVGLIVSEIVAVHETVGFSRNLLTVETPEAIPAYATLTNTCHAHGARVFAQLFHPGREVLSDPQGLSPIAWAPSAVPNERFHITPKPMSAALIRDIVAGYGQTAARLVEAGFDGFEIVASHGYLPAQFIDPQVNLRDDEYGGDAGRRLRFLNDVIAEVRRRAETAVVGLRISASQMDGQGLCDADILAVCSALAPRVDYLSVVAGTSASLSGSVHIVPPMGLASAYTAPLAAAVRAAASVPVIVTGRINQPQVANDIIARGEADLCGMTRALICDPLLPAKAQAGRLDDIRACIGCNQACIGRAHKGIGISCIQHPVAGRETELAAPPRIGRPRRVVVAGGGPAGMKAASEAAARGHDVVVHERERQLGGQARLAERLPGREQFGGLVTNLEREMLNAGVAVMTGSQLTAATLRRDPPDVIVVATGAVPRLPEADRVDGAHVVTAWDVLEDRTNIGASVVIADWRADWIGLGLAERLARTGSSVRLCVNAAMAGEAVQLYTRNHYVGRLYRLGVTILPHLRLFGADADTVYMQNTLSDEPVVLDAVDTLVLSLGHDADSALEAGLADTGIETIAVGDCVVPRTAEEAVYEGLKAGRMI